MKSRVVAFLLPGLAIAVGALALWFSRCGDHDAACRASILPADCLLRPGDIVFRLGHSVQSRVVDVADRQGHYSHVGIVVDSAGTLLVVHAVPGEPDHPGDVDRVKAELPAAFFAACRARAGAVVRTDRDSVAREAARQAWKIYQRRPLFDHDYDDSDTTRLYCTELVVLAYRRAGLHLTVSPGHPLRLPGLHVRCLFPSDVYRSPCCREVCSF